MIINRVYPYQYPGWTREGMPWSVGMVINRVYPLPVSGLDSGGYALEHRYGN